jgi:hypothetical protein
VPIGIEARSNPTYQPSQSEMWDSHCRTSGWTRRIQGSKRSRNNNSDCIRMQCPRQRSAAAHRWIMAHNPKMVALVSETPNLIH